MSDVLPEDVLAVAAQIKSMGGFPIVVSSTDPGVPYMVFLRPNLAELSGYVAKASDAAVGPLLAAVGLSRVSSRYPAADTLKAVEIERPFVIMRCVQAMLVDLGLSAKAQKKSL